MSRYKERFLLFDVSHGTSKIDGFVLYASIRCFQVGGMVDRGNRDTRRLLEE
jgi:hypothetical protein